MLNKFRLILCLLFAVTLSGCALLQPKTHSFYLYIMNEDWEYLKNKYEYHEVWPIIKELDSKNNIAEISEKDIKEYNWSTQEITLTTSASERLNSKISEESWFQIRVLKAVFIVIVDGQPMYGGVFIEKESQAGINFPVIYADTTNNQIVFQIRPVPLCCSTYQDLELSKKKTIEYPEIYTVFNELGKIVK